MTCIVGLVHEGEVWMGGDSAGVADWDLRVRADPKVFTNGPFLMGFTSSFRMGQLLQYALEAPEQPSKLADYQFMVTTFVDAVRSCLKRGGYASKENETEHGGCFLVGYRGSLYEIGGDYQVASPTDGIAAVGCGAQVALGALHVTGHLAAPERVETALKTAERFSAGVRGPFTILRTGQHG